MCNFFYLNFQFGEIVSLIFWSFSYVPLKKIFMYVLTFLYFSFLFVVGKVLEGKTRCSAR